ncbi:uncharacterized protein LOC135397005 [Ornithodoros turicata]|uniref:uncharacterized protein LOC135397005 n=1 Tax=Ornithodoros turicata TaxID=34597 RepID=UPI0031395A41
MKWKKLLPRKQAAVTTLGPMEICRDTKTTARSSLQTPESTADDASLSGSSTDSLSKKRNPPAKPPRRRHSVSSLKGSESTGNLRNLPASLKTMSHFVIGGGDGHTTDGNTTTRTDPVHWILEPPPSFGGSAAPMSLNCNHTFEGIGTSTPNDERGDFHSLPLSMSHIHKPNMQTLHNSTSYGLFARSVPPTAVRGAPYNNSPSPVTDRDVPDVVSRSRVTPGTSHTHTRRYCGMRQVFVPSHLSVPGHPRRTHSDPVIHLDEMAEENIAMTDWSEGRRKPIQRPHFGTEADACNPQPPLGGFAPEEMEALKKINTKLWTRVRHLQSQFELMKRVRNPEKPTPPGPNGNFSDLLADVYYAQRERDDAMHNRLRSANNGFDKAQKEMRRVADVWYDASDSTSSDDSTDDTVALSGLDKILHGIDSTRRPAKLQRHRDTLLTTVNHLKERRSRRHRSDVRALQAERDLALERVKVLEKELQEMHMKVIWKSESWTPTVVDTLQQVTQERNAALGKLQELQESLGTAHNGGSERTEEAPRISNEAQTDFIGIRENFVEKDSLKELRDEIERIGSRLETEILSRQNAEIKCQKLEEMIHNFQKRINGITSDCSQA